MSGPRHGIVREVNDKGHARVEFRDADNVVSYWLQPVQPLASGKQSRSYCMPEVGSQVSCFVDEHAQEGVILGAVYSDIDQPPTQNPAQIVNELRGGRRDVYDKDTGEYLLEQTAPHTIKIGASVVEITPTSISMTVGGAGIVIGLGGKIQSTGDMSHKGNAKFEGGSLRHNDKNVGSDHHHEGVTPGGGTTGDPLA
ncbi:Gp5/Type VI secretion system Vgr protein [Bartonella choladocola]|uniref:phage baseplate assembly protein V n=1 Tax=Bartonella choladocola TaxID=2750995 RepID=UPI003997AB3F